MNFSNKIALVTGGSSGIGRSIARKLSAHGASVVITGRNEEMLKESAALGDNISYVVADVSKPDDIQHTFAEVVRRHQKLDILVNNAGIAEMRPIEEANLEHLDRTFSVNIRGAFESTQQALPLLKKTGGTIVNIGTTLTYHDAPMMAAYCASKAALVSLTKSWAKGLAPHGIRVNIVHPGPIETPGLSEIWSPGRTAEANGGKLCG